MGLIKGCGDAQIGWTLGRHLDIVGTNDRPTQLLGEVKSILVVYLEYR